MCGRFSLSSSVKVIAKTFEIAHPEFDFEWNPHYNIAPTQTSLAIITEGSKKMIAPMVWGFIPHFSKTRPRGFPMINARAETAPVKPYFKDSFQNKRCLIPADGFYEWKKNSKEKVPYRMTLTKRELFAFAGLWDTWVDPNGVEIKSFTILTTRANSLMSQLHDRMPVILEKMDEHIWLDEAIHETQILESLLKPYPENEMQLYEVSPIVNSWKNDSPECLLPKKDHDIVKE